MGVYFYPSNTETELQNAYIGSMPREPGANTIAYYKFDGNLNDSSGNSRNMSMANGSFSYSTLSSGAKYVQTEFNSYTTTMSSFPFSSVSGTISFWMSFTNNTTGNGGSGRPSGTYPGATVLDLIGANGLVRPILSWYGNGGFCYGFSLLNIAGDVSSQSSYYPQGTSDSWHYYCMTFSSGTVKIYVDGQLFKTGTVSTDTSFSYKLNSVALGDAKIYSSRDKLSELIFENKVRTATEELNYYNNIKGNYGIS